MMIKTKDRKNGDSRQTVRKSSFMVGTKTSSESSSSQICPKGRKTNKKNDSLGTTHVKPYDLIDEVKIRR